MTFLATNLQVLRKHYKRTQQAVADDLQISRSSLSGYNWAPWSRLPCCSSPWPRTTASPWTAC